MSLEERLIKDFNSLSDDKKREVVEFVEFVEFLKSKNRQIELQ